MEDEELFGRMEEPLEVRALALASLPSFFVSFFFLSFFSSSFLFSSLFTLLPKSFLKGENLLGVARRLSRGRSPSETAKRSSPSACKEASTMSSGPGSDETRRGCGGRGGGGDVGL